MATQMWKEGKEEGIEWRGLDGKNFQLQVLEL